MKITCAISQTVPYMDTDGKPKQCVLRPGAFNYPMLKPKTDALCEDALRVLRKHGKISFENLLPSDVEVLKNLKAGETLREKVTLKPSPAGRIVNAVKNHQKAAKKNKPTKGHTDNSGESRGLSGKK